MNEYQWQDLAEGLEAEFEVDLKDADVSNFAALSGDTNPLHCDAAYARSLGHKGVVAHGLLTASFYSRLVGIYLPGRRCLLHGIDAQFMRPVHPGDRLKISGQISHLNHAYRQARIAANVVNQTGEVVSKAKITVGII